MGLIHLNTAVPVPNVDTAVSPLVQLYLQHLLSFLQNTSIGLTHLNTAVPVPYTGTAVPPAFAVIPVG